MIKFYVLCLTTLLFIVTPSQGILDRLPLDRNDATLFSVVTNCVDESEGSLEKAKECFGCFKRAFGSEEEILPNDDVHECFSKYFIKGKEACGEVNIKGLPQEEANVKAWNAILCLDRELYHRNVNKCASKVGGNTMEKKVSNMIKCLSKVSAGLTVKGKDVVGDNIEPKSEEYEENERKAQAAEMETHCSASSENINECHDCFADTIIDENTPDIQKFLTLSRCTTDYLGSNYNKCFKNKKLIQNLGNENVKVILFHCYEHTLEGYLFKDCLDENPSLLTNSLQDSYYNVKECTRAERYRQFKENFPEDVQKFLEYPLEFESKIFVRPQ